MSWYDYVELLENSSQDLSSIIQSSIHIRILVHISNLPWRNSGVDHFIVKGQALFTHSIILRLLSLDVVWSWTTSKDELTLIDPHQLPHCPCVVCHCCFDLWRFDFDLMIFFFFWDLALDVDTRCNLKVCS